MQDHIIGLLTAKLNRDSPVPLYHQIASVVRWEIGMGRFTVGTSLPGIRTVAETLSVNYQTVRKAYGALAAEGVVECQRGSRTTIKGFPKQESQHLGPGGETLEHLRGRVWVVECNLTQASDLGRQLLDSYAVRPVPWLLGTPGEPPGGVIVGSTFHESEMRTRWPARTGDIRAFELVLDPDVTQVVLNLATVLSVTRLVIVGRDQATATSLRDEVGHHLRGQSIELVAASPVRPATALDVEPDSLVGFAPRVWDRLPWSVKAHPRSFTFSFEFPSSRVHALAAELGWTPQPESRA